MKKNISITLLSIAILSGCAVKEKDSTAMKTLKHTVSAPLYLMYGVGAMAEVAMMAPLIAVAYAVKGVSNENENNSTTDTQYSHHYGRTLENDTISIKYLKDRSNEGDSDSQVKLGYAYQNGINTNKDLKKARYWYEIASLNDEPAGTHNLGILYYNGYGVDINKEKAHELFSQSAKSNLAVSQNTLGYIYSHDKDFKNFELALNWYEKAIQNGSIDAKCNIVYPMLESDNSSESKQRAKQYVSQAKLQSNNKYCTTVWNHYKLDEV